MTDYKNGKIYVIKTKETEEVYIGSTCECLKSRFSKHKSCYKRSLLGVKFRDTTSGKILKYADAFIELIENFPCNTKKELLDREGHFIRSTPSCVNTQIQGRTMKEYREDNDEKLKEQGKEYREKNREMINAKNRERYNSDKGKENREKNREKRNVKVPCPICNKEYSKSNLSRHMKIHKN
jgi:hypothetical protein